MIQPAIRLESPNDILILDALDGWGILNIDLGDPETRPNSQNAPDADGTLDFTSFVGARVITVGLELVEFTQSMWTMINRLKGFTRPRVPLKFCIKLDDLSPWIYTQVRRSTWTNPLEDLWVQHPIVQWVAPSGIFETVDPSVVTILPAGAGLEIGRTYDRVGDRVYPASPVLGSGSVTNLGTAECYPLLRIYGPCTNPVLYNDTQGKALFFTGLTIAAGQFLEIDTREKTILYQGVATDSRYNTLVFTSSSWWTLSSGVNSLRFIPATSAAGSLLEVTYFHSYL